MSMETHIHSVAQKRAAIKLEIAAEMAHPRPNFGRITELKKQNLRLKEEMLRYFKSLRVAS